MSLMAAPGAQWQEAPASRCRGEQRPRGQRPPRPCGRSGPARGGIGGGHRGPVSEAALGQASAQKCPSAPGPHPRGRRQPDLPLGGLFAYFSVESLSIVCTKELWGLICLSLLVLYLFISSRVFHKQKFLILMKCDLLMFSFNLKMLCIPRSQKFLLFFLLKDLILKVCMLGRHQL